MQQILICLLQKHRNVLQHPQLQNTKYVKAQKFATCETWSIHWDSPEHIVPKYITNTIHSCSTLKHFFAFNHTYTFNLTSMYWSCPCGQQLGPARPPRRHGMPGPGNHRAKPPPPEVCSATLLIPIARPYCCQERKEAPPSGEAPDTIGIA
jgi:hypothetical protein